MKQVTRWVSLTLMISLIFLSGCNSLFNKSQTEVVKDTKKGTEQKVTVLPDTDSKGYQTIVSKTESQTRGYIQYGVDNREDINEIETGLMRLSKSHFSPNNYVFQGGSFIAPQDIETLLSRKSKKNPNGLNPPLGEGSTAVQKAENSPKILSYILEQDYLEKKGDNYQLGGVSLAISFNQVYKENIRDNQGLYNTAEKQLSISKVKAQAPQYAQKIIEYVRNIKGLESVPIFVTLYLESPPESAVPGYYFDSAMVSSNSTRIGKWTKINEKTILFPSSEAANKYTADSQNFDKFKSDVQSYFPNFVGVMGKGFYKDGQLQNLDISIPIRFYDETEVMSFTQYVSMLISDKFPFSKDISVSVSISSSSGQEALIVKDPTMETPFVHVYQ